MSAAPETSRGSAAFRPDWAAQPDMLRALQKDELYIGQLVESCQEALRCLLGPVHALRCHREARLLAVALYYGLTTGLGLQTPGEEYCDIVQVTGRGSAPARTRRLAVVALEVLGPYLSEVAARRLERVAPGTEPDGGGDDDGDEPCRSSSGATAQLDLSAPSPAGWRLYLHAMRAHTAVAWPHVKGWVLWCARVHLAFFYLRGAYVQWSKRACGVRYATTVVHPEGRPSYVLLGVLLVAQLLLSAADDLHARWAQRKGVQQDDAGAALLSDEDVAAAPPGSAKHAASTASGHGGSLQTASWWGASQRTCALCLSTRRQPTSTPCGHVFCWACVTHWCAEKPECPLCRTAVAPQQLVCVYHTDL